MVTDKLLSIVLLVIFFLSSCVKDPQGIPDGITDNPVFTLSGQLGNAAINIKAGEGGWTMQPFYYQDSTHLVYSTLFSMDGCTQDCPSSLEFRFYREYPSSLNHSLDFTQTIQAGEKEFLVSDEERDSFLITLATHPGLFMSGVSSWENINIPGTTFQPEVSSVIGYEQNMHVCFQSLAFTGCQYAQCINFDPSTLVPCILSIEPKLIGPRHVSLTVRPQGTSPFEYKWMNGSKDATIVTPLQDTIVDIYASVEVTDALGNQATLTQIIRMQDGFIDPCYFPITMTSTPVHQVAPEVFAGKVEFIYTDGEGQKWKTTSGVQASNPVMIISDVSYFDLTPEGDPAYQVSLHFSVELFNELTGESKYFSVQDAVIALAHP